MAKIKRGLIRTEIKLKAKNAKYLPVMLVKREIKVLNFTPIGQDVCVVTIDYRDYKKFFAICKNMCYNILAVKYKGILSPVMLIIKRAGIAVGALAFFLSSFILSNFLLKIEVTGSGDFFEKEAVSLLNEMGIKKYSLLTSVNCEALSKALLQANDRLSFVSVTKRGNSLVINVEATNPPSLLEKQTTNLLSPCDGVIEEISVLRGTPLKREGDAVKKGDELIGAYITLKDESVYETFIIARVKIIATEEYFHACQNPTEEDVRAALTIAEFLCEGEVVEKQHLVTDTGVKITLSVRYVT